MELRVGRCHQFQCDSTTEVKKKGYTNKGEEGEALLRVDADRNLFKVILSKEQQMPFSLYFYFNLSIISLISAL